MFNHMRQNQFLPILFLGITLLSRSTIAGAESMPATEITVLFNMENLINVDPYDIAALEERFAAGRNGHAEKGSEKATIYMTAVAYALGRVLSFSGEPEKARKIFEEIEALMRKAHSKDAIPSILAAHIYLELIVDGPSWMRYNSDLESAINRMEKTGAPPSDIAYVKAKRFALFPSEIGGDLTRSLELFHSIDDGDALFEYTTRYAIALIAVGNRAEARALLEKQRATNYRDIQAEAILDRLHIEDSGALVSRVILPEGIRTAKDRITRAIQLRVGEHLSPETIAEDLQRLSELPGINHAEVHYLYDKDVNEVQARYLVSEEKSRSIAAFMSGTLHAGPHGSEYLYHDEKAFNAAIVYNDSNLFGRAWNINFITAGIYNLVELSKEGFADTPFDVSLEAEGLFLSGNELFFYDEHRYLIEESALTSRYLQGGVTVGATTPLGVYLRASYGVRKDWYTQEEKTPILFSLPSDLLHTARMNLELNMQGHHGPAGLIPIGFRLGTELEYDYYQGFSEWGTPSFWNKAPDKGYGTFTYGVEASYGTLFLERFNAGVALGAFGGCNYYTRTYHRLGASAGPMFSSSLFLRGYRGDEFIAKTVYVGHLDAGYELSVGKLHLGLFSDVATLFPAFSATGAWRNICSAGLSIAAVLPWEIQLFTEFGHGFVDLTGSWEHGHETLSLTLIRSFSF